MAESSVPDCEAFEQLLASMDSQGRDFERLCAWFLESDPEYATEFEQVWLWNDWPGNWGRDKGIDLIARKYDGQIAQSRPNTTRRPTTSRKRMSTRSCPSPVGT